TVRGRGHDGSGQSSLEVEPLPAKVRLIVPNHSRSYMTSLSWLRPIAPAVSIRWSSKGRGPPTLVGYRRLRSIEAHARFAGSRSLHPSHFPVGSRRCAPDPRRCERSGLRRRYPGTAAGSAASCPLLVEGA